MDGTGRYFEALMDADEQLRGIAVAHQAAPLLGRDVAVAATDRRLILLPVDQDGRPNYAPTFITPDRIVDWRFDGERELRLELRANKEKLRLTVRSGAGVLADWLAEDR